MNIKFMAGLAVVVAFVSAMTFVGLLSSAKSADSGSAAAETTKGSAAGVPGIPSPDVTKGSATVETSVTAGGEPVQTRVNVTE